MPKIERIIIMIFEGLTSKSWWKKSSPSYESSSGRDILLKSILTNELKFGLKANFYQTQSRTKSC